MLGGHKGRKNSALTCAHNYTETAINFQIQKLYGLYYMVFPPCRFFSDDLQWRAYRLETLTISGVARIGLGGLSPQTCRLASTVNTLVKNQEVNCARL